MATLEVKNSEGKAAGKVDVADEIIKTSYRPFLMHDYVVMQSRAKRAGTHSTKTRSEVALVGQKPFKQKGTGRARQGSLKGPHQYGGGVAFGPKPRSYESSLNAKAKKEAIRGALSQKNFESKLFAIESFEIDSGKTKDALKAFDKLGTLKCLLVGDFSEATKRATQNLRWVRMVSPAGLNVYDILLASEVYVTKDAWTAISERLKKKARAA